MSQLLKIDELFPGCKDLLKHYGISIQGQERYPLRTAVDQRGEQTPNRDAKTSGGIMSFAGNIDAVTKWTLNRSAQAKVTGELKRLTGIEGAQDSYKQSRPHHIVKRFRTYLFLQSQMISQVSSAEVDHRIGCSI